MLYSVTIYGQDFSQPQEHAPLIWQAEIQTHRNTGDSLYTFLVIFDFFLKKWYLLLCNMLIIIW